jgi:hypothetical protein
LLPCLSIVSNEQQAKPHTHPNYLCNKGFESTPSAASLATAQNLMLLKNIMVHLFHELEGLFTHETESL